MDPTSFAGYLFVKNQLLEDAMNNPNTLLRRMGKFLEKDDNNGIDYEQLSFFSKEYDDLLSIEAGDQNV